MRISVLVVSFGVLAFGPFAALAQAPRSNSMMDAVIAAGGSNTCPEMAWNTRRDDKGNIRGVTWYTDGMGVSNAVGKVQPDGKFALTLTSIYGSGPTGTVTGTPANDGGTDVEFVGTTCRTGLVHLKPGQTSTH